MNAQTNPAEADGLRAIELGIFVYPVGYDKKPVDQWRHGEQDFVVKPMTTAQWTERCRDIRVHGVAALGSEVSRMVTFDIEAPGTDVPGIRAAMDRLPPTCRRRSPSGGDHGFVRIASGDYPGGSKALAWQAPKDGVEGAKPVLLAEIRAHGGYAVLTGPGRPPLADDFEVAEISREEFDSIADEIRAAGTFHPKVRRRRRFVNESAGIGGVQEVLHAALRDGAISPLALLPDGWTEVGYDSATGKIYLRRPGGEGQSGNTLNGITTIFSTSVDWATPGEPMNAAQVLTRSRFDDDYHAAMAWVEREAFGQTGDQAR